MVDSFIKFWSDSGWLANLLTIVVSSITICGLIYSLYQMIIKFSILKNDYSNIYNYVQDKNKSTNSIQLKSRKIAIIDDQPENYPVEYLRKSGFNVTVYEKVSLSNYSFIKDYDLIFLDITNVVEEDLERGGFELIKRVRNEMNDIVIIGVSSKRFDPTLTEFFKMADRQSKTPISEKDCETLIIDTLEDHYSPKTLASRIDTIIGKSSISHRQHKKVINSLTQYFNNEINSEKLNRAISKYAYCLDTHELYENSKKLKDVM